MASSQEKAVDLKDAYVQGIMDGEIASETANAFSAMPEQDMGEQASIIHDFHRNQTTQINNGDPTEYYIDPANGLYREEYNPEAARPVRYMEDNSSQNYTGWPLEQKIEGAIKTAENVFKGPGPNGLRQKDVDDSGAFTIEPSNLSLELLNPLHYPNTQELPKNYGDILYGVQDNGGKYRVKEKNNFLRDKYGWD